jgi:hypothetical protein
MDHVGDCFFLCPQVCCVASALQLVPGADAGCRQGAVPICGLGGPVVRSAAAQVKASSTQSPTGCLPTVCPTRWPSSAASLANSYASAHVNAPSYS